MYSIRGIRFGSRPFQLEPSPAGREERRDSGLRPTAGTPQGARARARRPRWRRFALALRSHRVNLGELATVVPTPGAAQNADSTADEIMAEASTLTPPIGDSMYLIRVEVFDSIGCVRVKFGIPGGHFGPSGGPSGGNFWHSWGSSGAYLA